VHGSDGSTRSVAYRRGNIDIAEKVFGVVPGDPA